MVSSACIAARNLLPPRCLTEKTKRGPKSPVPLTTRPLPQMPATFVVGLMAPVPSAVTAPGSSVVSISSALARCPSVSGCAYMWRVVCRDNSGAGAVVANFTEAGSDTGQPVNLTLTTGTRGAKVNIDPSTVSPVQCSVTASASYVDGNNETWTKQEGPTMLMVSLMPAWARRHADELYSPPDTHSGHMHMAQSNTCTCAHVRGGMRA